MNKASIARRGGVRSVDLPATASPLHSAKKVATFASGILAVVLSAHAQAQTASGSSVSRALLEEIVVTATKKAGGQSLQEAPVAISAFSSDQIDLLKISDIEGLNYSVPNASLGNTGSMRSVANFSIRGIGVNSSIPSVEPGVGTFIDGVYQGNNYGVIVDFMDVEAIEVLRGPQGLLFGRNVTGGAVLLRSARPTEEFSGRLKAKVETGIEQAYTAVMNGALSNNVNGRMAVYYKNDEGWFENKVDGSDLGADETLVVRPSLGFSIGESEHTLITEYGSVDGDGAPVQGRGLYDGHDVGVNNKGFEEIEWSRVTLESVWNVGFGNGSITNILGWRDVESDANSDLDASAATQVDFSFYLEQDQISNELRYNGTFGNTDVTAGIYYFSQDLFAMTRTVQFGALATSGGSIDHTAWGAFTQLDYHVNDRFLLSGGIRFNTEEKDASIAPRDLRSCNYETKSCSAYFEDSKEWNFVTPKLGFTWKFDERSHIYGFYTSGFRSGGFNLRQNVIVVNNGVPGGAAPFGQEEQDSFELGLKSTFNDGRTMVNIALFHNEVDGLQKDVTVQESSQTVQTTANTADARIQGVELELNHQITENLLLSANLGYLDAEYTDIFYDISGDGIINQRDKDLDLTRAPEVTGTLSLTHELALATGSLVSRFSYSHMDEHFSQDGNNFKHPAVDKIDVFFTYFDADGRWSVSLYGKNLTNEPSYGFGTAFPSPPFAASATLGINEGRTYGAELEYRF